MYTITNNANTLPYQVTFPFALQEVHASELLNSTNQDVLMQTNPDGSTTVMMRLKFNSLFLIKKDGTIWKTIWDKAADPNDPVDHGSYGQPVQQSGSLQEAQALQELLLHSFPFDWDIKFFVIYLSLFYFLILKGLIP